MDAPNQAWLDAVAENERELAEGITPEPELYIMSGGYDSYDCINYSTVQPISDASFSNGEPWPVSPDTGWDKIDDDPDLLNTSDFIEYELSYPGPDLVTVVGDSFNAGGIPAWPTVAKIRISCADFSGGGASGQWHQCSWKSADNKTIGVTAYEDIPSIIGTTATIHELDFVISAEDLTADLSSTKIGLRLLNGNVCEVRVYGVEVLYGIECGPCDTTLIARPNGTQFNGWTGDVVSPSPPLDRWEILATNNFTDSSYTRYVKIAETVGPEPWEPADQFNIGPQLSAWPISCKVRVRLSQHAVSVYSGVMEINVFDTTYGDPVASWGPAWEPLDYGTSPTTKEFVLEVHDYNEAVDLSNLVMSIRYSLSSGLGSDSDLRLYAYEVEFEQSCPELELGTGTLLSGGSHTKTLTFVPGTSGGVLAGGSSYVLAGMIAAGGARVGGSASIDGTTNLIGTGGMKLSGKQYQYRRTITVPAEKVSQDFDSFYLGVVAQINPAHVGSGFFVTSAAGPAVPYEIRSFTDGKLSLWVRTPVKAAQDTILYLYYGAT